MLTACRVFLTYLMIVPLMGFSQITRENQVWTSVQIEKKLFSKTRAELTLESRWNTNPVMAVRYFPNIAVQQKWHDYFTTTLHYRYIVSNKGLGVREASHRMMLDAITGFSEKKYSLSFRLRAGREDEPGVNEGIFTFSEFVLRQKLSVKRKVSKHELSVSVEQFETFRGNDVEYDQRRYTLGAEVKINKRNFLDFFVMYQDQIAVKRINIGAGYVYKL